MVKRAFTDDKLMGKKGMCVAMGGVRKLVVLRTFSRESEHGKLFSQHRLGTIMLNCSTFQLQLVGRQSSKRAICFACESSIERTEMRISRTQKWNIMSREHPSMR